MGASSARLRASTVTIIASAVSAASYGILYFAERAIFRNGLTLQIPEARPADRAGLALQIAAYVAATIVLYAMYAWMVASSRTLDASSERARPWSFVFPVVAHVAFLFARPFNSIDLWSYIAGGAGGNPYVTSPKAMGASEIGRRLLQLGWRPVHGPSPYGPLWIRWETLVGRLDDLALASVVMKLPVVIASLASAWLIHRILSRVRPEARLFGTALYLWNPMVILELAAEGHNDAMMLVFTLTSILFAVTRRPVASVFALGMGVLTKFVPLLFLPAEAVYLWCASRDRRALSVRMLLGTSLVVATAAWLYRPLWAGLHTFDGVRESASIVHGASFREALVEILTLAWPSGGAAIGVRVAPLIAVGAFAIVLGIATWRARTDERLLVSAGAIAVSYVFVGSAMYWPWYATLPVGLLALAPRRNHAIVIVLSFCSSLVAPVNNLRANRFITWDAQWSTTTFVGCVVPLIAILAVACVRRGSKKS